MQDSLQQILSQITIDMLPCKYHSCELTAHPMTDHSYRPETDLYELGWEDWNEEDEWDFA